MERSSDRTIRADNDWLRGHSRETSVVFFEELGLAEHGLEYLPVDPGGVAVGWDAPGPAPVFADVEQTVEALAVHYPHEAANYRRYAKDAVPVARMLRDLANADPTGLSLLRTAAVRHTPAALRLLRWSRMTFADVLRNYFTDEGILGPAMAGGPAVWGVAPDTPACAEEGTPQADDNGYVILEFNLGDVRLPPVIAWISVLSCTFWPFSVAEMRLPTMTMSTDCHSPAGLLAFTSGAFHA